MTVVYIDTFGKVVSEPKDIAFKVTLSGSYSYSHYFKDYRHEIASIEPEFPLTQLVHNTLLVTP